MPRLQTFSLRSRNRLAQKSTLKHRNYDSDSSGSDSEGERSRSRRSRKKTSLAAAAAAAAVVAQQSHVISPPQYAMFPSHHGQSHSMYRRRKKTTLAVAKKPDETRLAASRGGDSFFTVNLNLFTLLAIIGVAIVIVLMFNMKNQMVGLENKIQVMCATM
jgi:hypothetical protein